MSVYVEQRSLPVAATPDQWRVCTVQVYNWGRYQGVQRLEIGRKGAAILGPSGGGKSTLLDAMSSVIMPNPQEFNQAARDDMGKKSERTVYSYARGLLGQRPDSTSGRGTSTNYLRPAGSASFVSGTALTWESAAGRRATAVRLMWVASDTTDASTLNNSTMYGFINGDFDVTSLNGLKAVRPGASPLTRTTLESLVDPRRGDIFDASQVRLHSKMRDVLGMGETEASQKTALQLLRRAQASKGVFSINALFKEFVLIEPLALARWDTTLGDYREAVKLFTEFEIARKRLEVLSDLPGYAEQHRLAVDGHAGKLEILDTAARGSSRLQLWHAAKVHEWCEGKLEDIIEAKALASEDVQQTTADLARAKSAVDDLLDRLTSHGDDRAQVVRAKMDGECAVRERIEQVRGRAAKRLAMFGKRLPDSAGDLDLLLFELAELKKQIEKDKLALDTNYGNSYSKVRDLAARLQADEKEFKRLQGTRSNIPEDAASRRHRIAKGAGIPEADLPYAGELMQVTGSHKIWERALSNLLRPLARRILVSANDYEKVRRFVYEHQMDAEVTLQRVWTDRSHAAASEHGSVADFVEVATSPYAEWLAAEVAGIANYAPAQSESDFDRPAPRGMRGWIAANGMRSDSSDRVTKNDHRVQYTWIGWDNHALRVELAESIEATAREKNTATNKLAALHRDQTDAGDRVVQLGDLIKGLAWDEIGLDQVDDRLGRLQAELEATETPEMRELRSAHEEAQDKFRSAKNKFDSAAEAAAALVTEMEAVYEAKGCAWDIVYAEDPLSDDEQILLDDVTFAVPAGVAAIGLSFGLAEQQLRDQIDSHGRDRHAAEGTIVVIISRYRDTDEQFRRESDGTIHCLDAVLDIRRQLVDDDLPSARKRWLEKAGRDLNQQLRALIVQIESDGRDIRKGLDPINSVLDGVPFRNGTLSIEAVPRSTKEFESLQDVVRKYTSNTLGADQDPDDVEVRFVQLRAALASLEESTRIGEVWRRKAFDAREHFEFRATESRADGSQAVYEGVSGMSGGEGQELIAFILGAALRYRLGEGRDRAPSYATVILDEGFVKSDNDFTGRSLAAFDALGFHLIIGAPREKANAFEDFVDTVAYSSALPTDRNRIQLYSMTIEDAIRTGVGPSEES